MGSYVVQIEERQVNSFDQTVTDFKIEICPDYLLSVHSSEIRMKIN